MDTMKQSSRVQHNITKQIANLPGKCYHMMNVFGGKQEDINIWIRACKEEVKHFFLQLIHCLYSCIHPHNAMLANICKFVHFS